MRFSVDARTLIHLGRDSIRDRVTAVLELVKNSYDADAQTVLVEIRAAQAGIEPMIRITDNGDGMSREDLETKWLRIGFSDKIADKRTSRFGRRRTGEKGIGRLSCDRLGSTLLLSTRHQSGSSTGATFNWDEFAVPGRRLEDVPVLEVRNATVEAPANWPTKSHLGSGTQLTITGLRDTWSADDLAELHDELSSLTSPFAELDAFGLHLHSTLTNDFNGEVRSKFLDGARVEVRLEWTGSQMLQNYVSRYPGRPAEESADRIPWEQLVRSRRQNAVPTFGPTTVRLMLFPRNTETARGTGLDMSDLREFLDQNAGVKIYRDGIRVRPYGDLKHPLGDWLQLADRKSRDPAGASRATWRVAPNQLVGFVSIGRDANPLIVDSASREGLIASEALTELREFVMAAVVLLESHYHEMFKEQKSTSARSKTEAVDALGSSLRDLENRLVELQKGPRHSPSPAIEQRTAEAVTNTIDVIKSTRQTIEDLASHSATLRGLATVGIAAAVFGHETPSMITQVQGSVVAASALLVSDPNAAEQELRKAKDAAERLLSWSKFALGRIRRDKRRRIVVDVAALTSKLLDDLTPVLDASSVALERSVSAVSGRTFAIDIESVLVNLMTNAFHACSQKAGRRRIRVELLGETHEGRDGMKIVVSDSGPGVAPKFQDRIWEPLFTTRVDDREKPVGTGLGLSIVQGIVDDLRGRRQVDTSPDLGGARFTIWLPLGK